MGQYRVGFTTTGAGTALQPVFGILNTAAVTGLLVELMMWNTTTTEVTYRLVRITGGTPGPTLTASKDRVSSPPALCVPKGLWTANATIDSDVGPRKVLAASKGASNWWAFGDNGIEFHSLGATLGIGLVPVGTGQICEVAATWRE